MSTAMHYFRENLKKIMDENGMSQKDLAKRVDVVPQALNK
jgi:DNA-binding XRE family transcriptional regulator